MIAILLAAAVSAAPTPPSNLTTLPSHCSGTYTGTGDTKMIRSLSCTGPGTLNGRNFSSLPDCPAHLVCDLSTDKPSTPFVSIGSIVPGDPCFYGCSIQLSQKDRLWEDIQKHGSAWVVYCMDGSCNWTDLPRSSRVVASTVSKKTGPCGGVKRVRDLEVHMPQCAPGDQKKWRWMIYTMPDGQRVRVHGIDNTISDPCPVGELTVTVIYPGNNRRIKCLAGTEKLP